MPTRSGRRLFVFHTRHYCFGHATPPWLFVPPEEEDSEGVFAFAFAHLSRRSLSYGVSTYVARLGPHREKSSRGQYFTATVVKMERSYYDAVLFVWGFFSVIKSRDQLLLCQISCASNSVKVFHLCDGYWFVFFCTFVRFRQSLMGLSNKILKLINLPMN